MGLQKKKKSQVLYGASLLCDICNKQKIQVSRAHQILSWSPMEKQNIKQTCLVWQVVFFCVWMKKSSLIFYLMYGCCSVIVVFLLWWCCCVVKADLYFKESSLVHVWSRTDFSLSLTVVVLLPFCCGCSWCVLEANLCLNESCLVCEWRRAKSSHCYCCIVAVLLLKLCCCFVVVVFLKLTCVSMSRLLCVYGGELTRRFTELLLASVSDFDSGLGWSWTPLAWKITSILDEMFNIQYLKHMLYD